jgi:Tfp pilus assembly protein PilV
VLRKRLKEESGYSLIEVLASMVLLTLAIIPMLGMFDTGLRGITTSSNYDKVRALANLKMEEAKSLPFATVEGSFPVSPSTPDANGHYQSGWTALSDTDPSVAADFPNLKYRVDKQYLNQPTVASPTFSTSSTPTKLIRVTITVGWGTFSGGTYDKMYTTYGLVTE